MFSRRLIVLLMLIMAIKPVAVTYAHYSAIEQFSLVHTVVASGMADDDGMSSVQHDDHCQPSKSHPAACSFHACVDCAITTSFVFGFMPEATIYRALVKLDSISIIPPPDIKPPIF